jgi:hypothetical protein
VAKTPRIVTPIRCGAVAPIDLLPHGDDFTRRDVRIE